MVNYKTLSFNYPLNKVKIVWNFKNRFDVYTIDNAQKICNKIVNFEIE